MNEEQQLDLFGEPVSVDPKQASRKSKEVPKSSVSVRKDTRPGVCECGSGKFKLSVHESIWTRVCKNQKCKKQVIV
jgi:hypothetical protein